MKITREDYLKTLIQTQYPSIRSFSEHINMPYSTLTSILKNVGGASVDNIIKICKGLGISTDQLEKLEEQNQLSQKDEKEINEKIESILSDMDSTTGLAAYGGTIDSEDDIELIKSSLEQALKLAKRTAKSKFTPNKYKQ
ncbi:helix-turn-helix domain-containing protein [Veillonella caviae]|uniref:helix-turn-helix domain-containing protein n=1 Tax=Veillonella caviae TaxID=248316 RepID=UPI002353ADDA|nr:helix-turn-helix transcriptional regulator [Veillonella caviae]